MAAPTGKAPSSSWIRRIAFDPPAPPSAARRMTEPTPRQPHRFRMSLLGMTPMGGDSGAGAIFSVNSPLAIELLFLHGHPFFVQGYAFLGDRNRDPYGSFFSGDPSPGRDPSSGSPRSFLRREDPARRRLQLRGQGSARGRYLLLPARRRGRQGDEHLPRPRTGQGRHSARPLPLPYDPAPAQPPLIHGLEEID